MRGFIKKAFALIIDTSVVLMLFAVVGIVVSFSTIVVLDLPTEIAITFIQGYMMGTFTILIICLLLVISRNRK